eukprot:TRINITY_DN11717_c0_g1_i1.p1 TRINITY_DN11717_c0_g1~~TRINITY_DN11717_c0_g1_i1.p1  ORF type:complete len:819 (-),score=81.31 TRINITY_DN11717_c0_g1_i1:365-2821(-)
MQQKRTKQIKQNQFGLEKVKLQNRIKVRRNSQRNLQKNNKKNISILVQKEIARIEKQYQCSKNEQNKQNKINSDQKKQNLLKMKNNQLISTSSNQSNNANKFQLDNLEKKYKTLSQESQEVFSRIKLSKKLSRKLENNNSNILINSTDKFNSLLNIQNKKDQAQNNENGNINFNQQLQNNNNNNNNSRNDDFQFENGSVKLENITPKSFTSNNIQNLESIQSQQPLLISNNNENKNKKRNIKQQKREALMSLEEVVPDSSACLRKGSMVIDSHNKKQIQDPITDNSSLKEQESMSDLTWYDDYLLDEQQHSPSVQPENDDLQQPLLPPFHTPSEMECDKEPEIQQQQQDEDEDEERDLRQNTQENLVELSKQNYSWVSDYNNGSLYKLYNRSNTIRLSESSTITRNDITNWLLNFEAVNQKPTSFTFQYNNQHKQVISLEQQLQLPTVNIFDAQDEQHNDKIQDELFYQSNTFPINVKSNCLTNKSILPLQSNYKSNPQYYHNNQQLSNVTNSENTVESSNRSYSSQVVSSKQHDQKFTKVNADSESDQESLQQHQQQYRLQSDDNQGQIYSDHQQEKDWLNSFDTQSTTTNLLKDSRQTLRQEQLQEIYSNEIINSTNSQQGQRTKTSSQGLVVQLNQIQKGCGEYYPQQYENYYKDQLEQANCDISLQTGNNVRKQSALILVTNSSDELFEPEQDNQDLEQLQYDDIEAQLNMSMQFHESLEQVIKKNENQYQRNIRSSIRNDFILHSDVSTTGGRYGCRTPWGKHLVVMMFGGKPETFQAMKERMGQWAYKMARPSRMCRQKKYLKEQQQYSQQQ